MNTKVLLIASIALIVGIGVGYLLNCSKSPSDEPTMHSEMAGMIEGLAGKTGDAFDKAFISEMIVHHEGAVEMARAALVNAQHSELKTMAEAIIAAQTAEIAEMRRWQDSWYGESELHSAELIGTTWVWRHSVIGGDALFAPDKAGAFTITFGENGQVNGTTDCNNFFGQYTRTGDVIEIGPFGMTKMFCEDSQENEFTSALTEGQLTISFEHDGTLVLQFSESTSMIFDRAE